MRLDDHRPPVTIDQVIEYRDELLRLAWVITQEQDNEDFVHDFFLVEKRRNRIANWTGRELLSSWLLTTMRYYRANINKAWRNYRPLYDGSRPWSAWCDSTAVIEWPVYRHELRSMMDSSSQTVFDSLLDDEKQKDLARFPSQACTLVQTVRDTLQPQGLLWTGDRITATI